MNLFSTLAIILIATTMCHPASSPDECKSSEYQFTAKPILIWFGATQTGKSSSIKLLTGNDSIACGALGRGASTTSDISLYREIRSKMSRPYLHMDTIGFGDTRLNFSDADIRTKIELQILRLSQSKSINKIQAIVLVQSFYGDSQQLSKNLLQVAKILGHLPSNSMIILGTKWNSITHEEMIIEREQVIMEIMEQHGIPKDHYLRFSIPYKYLKESQIDVTQFAKLQKIIRKCQQVQIESIGRKHKQIHQLALQIQQQNAREVDVEVFQDKIEFEIKKEVYTHYIPYTYQQCRFFGWLCRYQTVWIDDIRERDIKVPYTVQQKVKKNVIFYDDFERSYHLALQEFESRMLQQIINAE